MRILNMQVFTWQPYLSQQSSNHNQYFVSDWHNIVVCLQDGILYLLHIVSEFSPLLYIWSLFQDNVLFVIMINVHASHCVVFSTYFDSHYETEKVNRGHLIVTNFYNGDSGVLKSKYLRYFNFFVLFCFVYLFLGSKCWCFCVLVVIVVYVCNDKPKAQNNFR